jgi:hypothetical protein
MYSYFEKSIDTFPEELILKYVLDLNQVIIVSLKEVLIFISIVIICPLSI